MRTSGLLETAENLPPLCIQPSRILCHICGRIIGWEPFFLAIGEEEDERLAFFQHERCFAEKGWFFEEDRG